MPQVPAPAAPGPRPAGVGVDVDGVSAERPVLIAGRVSLAEVVARLRVARPVFYSEADLQHSFARTLWELDPQVQSRLEVRQHVADKHERLDLLCIGPTARTAIEFKYFTRAWTGTAGPLAEPYALRSHAATDLARLHFVSDIERLERFCPDPEQNGLALLITNDPALWTPPGSGAKPTRDSEFRIHQGRTLHGTLQWPQGMPVENTRALTGSYALDWRPYSQQDGAMGRFQYLAVPINPQP
jgi:hypothetical protein